MTDKLKELALAAKSTAASSDWARHWSAYEDAASPDAILALLKRAEDAEAELALRTAEVDSLNIDKGHMRAEVERLTALEEATRKANLDCMDHYNEVLADWKEATAKNRELQAEVERLKAQVGEWQGLAGIQGDMIKTIASGAAQKEQE